MSSEKAKAFDRKTPLRCLASLFQCGRKAPHPRDSVASAFFREVQFAKKNERLDSKQGRTSSGDDAAPQSVTLNDSSESHQDATIYGIIDEITAADYEPESYQTDDPQSRDERSSNGRHYQYSSTDFSASASSALHVFTDEESQFTRGTHQQETGEGATGSSFFTKSGKLDLVKEVDTLEPVQGTKSSWLSLW